MEEDNSQKVISVEPRKETRETEESGPLTPRERQTVK